jgi:hypothetical protein
VKKKFPEGPRVGAVLLDTPDFFVVEEGHPVWIKPIGEVTAADVPRGCFVRVEPPEGASDEVVEHLRKRLELGGAAAVRVMPRRRGAVVPAAALSKLGRFGTREVVLQLVEAARTTDRAALREAVEAALAASGL